MPSTAPRRAARSQARLPSLRSRRCSPRASRQLRRPAPATSLSSKAARRKHRPTKRSKRPGSKLRGSKRRRPQEKPRPKSQRKDPSRKRCEKQEPRRHRKKDKERVESRKFGATMATMTIAGAERETVRPVRRRHPCTDAEAAAAAACNRTQILHLSVRITGGRRRQTPRRPAAHGRHATLEERPNIKPRP